MPTRFSLVLTRPAADARRSVAGLPLVLRLALDAQQGGVTTIVLGAGCEELADTLRDARLRALIAAYGWPGEDIAGNDGADSFDAGD